MKTIAVPAVIAETQEELDKILSRIYRVADRIMLDIMDGEFVENESLNFDFTSKPGPEYEAHLMVVNPLEWMTKLLGKVQRVIVHLETIDNIQKLLDYSRGNGIEFYVAINPDTEIEGLAHILEVLDGVLVMTVTPGRYGSKFISDTLKTVELIRSWNPSIPIEVDGGMNPETSKLAREVGATIIASGSYIVKSRDVRQAIEQLQADL